MDQEQFFSTIEWNLKQLAHEHAPLPEHNLPLGDFKALKWFRGAFRVRQLLEISRTDPPAPRNIKVWDLVGRRIVGARPFKFRIFACYAETASVACCREAKLDLRQWYELSGLSRGHDLPYSGALVIGCAERLPDEVKPKGFDLPPCVTLETWTCSGTPAPVVKSFGEGVGEIVERAIMPETFSDCKARVQAAIDSELDADHGHVTVDVIAEKTSVPANVISHIFREMMGEGDCVLHRLPRRNDCGQKRTRAQRLYIERGSPTWLRRYAARKMGKWYVQDGFLPACALTATGALLWLCEKFAFKYLSMPVFAHRWLTIGVGVVLVIALAGLGIGILRRK